MAQHPERALAVKLDVARVDDIDGAVIAARARFGQQSMTMNPPALPDYDIAALSQAAGNGHWRGGDDPETGARALLAALDSPQPPARLILGQQGLDVVELHEGRRLEERAQWRAASELRTDR